MDLKKTVSPMFSADFRERFKAEYLQTKDRFEKLRKLNLSIEAARLTDGCEKHVDMPVHVCPEDILLKQQCIMAEYLRVLEIRALIEGIDLSDDS